MRIHPINELPSTIILGRQTETGVNEVRLDCAEWLALWPLPRMNWAGGGDVLYKSLIDANVWTPDAHPAGWEVV